MRHALLAALSRPRRAGADARAARGGRPPGARDRVRRDVRVPARARRRGRLRRPAPGRAQRAARAARRGRRRPPRADGRRARRRRGRDARVPLERGARRAARARQLRRAPGWPPSGCSRSARRSATSSARWSCGTACPTPRSAPGCDRADLLRHAAAAARHAGERARSVALVAQGDRRASTPAPTRCARRSCYERLGNYLRWAGADRGGLRGLRARDGAAARRRERRSGRGCSSTARARLMLRGSSRGRRGGRRRRWRWPSGSATRRSRPGAQHARPVARRARRRRRGHRDCCARSRDLAARDGPPVERVAGGHQPQRGAGPAGPHRGGARGSRPGWPALRKNPERTTYDTFLECRGSTS